MAGVPMSIYATPHCPSSTGRPTPQAHRRDYQGVHAGHGTWALAEAAALAFRAERASSNCCSPPTALASRWSPRAQRSSSSCHPAHRHRRRRRSHHPRHRHDRRRPSHHHLARAHRPRRPVRRCRQRCKSTARVNWQGRSWPIRCGAWTALLFSHAPKR